MEANSHYPMRGSLSTYICRNERIGLATGDRLDDEVLLDRWKTNKLGVLNEHVDSASVHVSGVYGE
jgi:hypothetical protein